MSADMKMITILPYILYKCCKGVTQTKAACMQALEMMAHECPAQPLVGFGLQIVRPPEQGWCVVRWQGDEDRPP